MAYIGVLGNLLPRNPLFLSNLLGSKQLLVPVFMSLFIVYLFSPLLVQFFQRKNPKTEEPPRTEAPHIRIRFYLGLAVFLVPAFFCIFCPISLAKKIDPMAGTTQGLTIDKNEALAGPIYKGVAIRQDFIAEKDRLSIVSVMLATYARENKCNATFTLYDSNNVKIASQVVDGAKIKDNAFFDFYFPLINNSKGKKYSIELQSDGNEDNTITVWKTKKKSYPEGELLINGIPLNGDMCIKVFYEF
jgi:hypothetical protein